MSYRPTVRYPNIYKDYVEEVFRATTLDRNQIIRLALFIAAHSEDYQAILKKYKAADVPLPHPGWEKDEDRCWLEQNYIKKHQDPPPAKLIKTGGIKIVIG